MLDYKVFKFRKISCSITARFNVNFRRAVLFVRYTRGKVVPAFKQYAMKMYGRVEVKLHSFQISASDGRH
jgi:hypothetical protein